MKTEDVFTIDELRECLVYDPMTGVLTWKRRPLEGFASARAHARWNTIFAGTEAGCVSRNDRNTYRRLLFRRHGKKHTLSAHRIAWALHNGAWPEGQIDHMDGDGLNNRIENLRDVPNSVNQRNQRRPKNNTSGHVGVSWYRRTQRWQAKVNTDAGTKKKYFSDLEEAVAWRADMAAMHGYTDRHGAED